MPIKDLLHGITESLRIWRRRTAASFLFETAVMDGAPIFKMVRECFKMCRVTEIKGILNSTTNYILQGLEQGKVVKDIVSESKEKRIYRGKS